MKPKEIIESNKLIAEFMGAKNTPIIGGEVLHPISGHIISYKNEIYQADFNTVEGINNIPPSERKRYFRYFEEDLKYHSSWDWLMPVVENIEGIGADILIGRMFCEIKFRFPLSPEKEFDVRIVSGIKMNAIHGAIIEFIKWYNQNKKK